MRLRFGVASDQLSAQPHSRSNSEKKTSHNNEQHLYGFDIESDRTRDPKESQHSVCDVNVSTVLTRFSKDIFLIMNTEKVHLV
jgi:hypothetical protein